MNQIQSTRARRIEVAEDRELTDHSLVGSFFHADAVRSWQGVVVAEVAPQVYLVELFSWLDGHSTNQELVELGEMLGWTFYDTAEWMSERRGPAEARWKREREQQASA